MGEQKVYFYVDGLTLSGVLLIPHCSPIALIVGAHGLLADKASPKQIALADRLSSNKMAYFRFDHRGCGESEGSFNEQTTLENRRSDLIAAVQAARDILGDEIPLGLFGSSLGGTICLAAAKYVVPFAVVTLAAPVQSKSIQLPPGAPDSLNSEIVGSRLAFDIQDEIQNIKNILIVHGSADETVPVKNAETIYRLSGSPKALFILENGDHRVSDPIHQKRFIETAADWYATCHRNQIQLE